MAKKTKKSAENNRSSNRSSHRRYYSDRNSQAHRGSAQVQPLVRILQGRGPQGQRRLRMQNRQKRYPLHAPAQSPLRSDDFPNHLRTPPVRGRKGGVSLSCFPCKSNPQDSRPCNANIPVTQLPANGTSMPTTTSRP